MFQAVREKRVPCTYCHAILPSDLIVWSRHIFYLLHTLNSFSGGFFPIAQWFLHRGYGLRTNYIHRSKWSHSFPETICHTRYNHIIGDALQTTNNVLSPQNCRRNEESFHTVWDWKFEIINCPAANTKSAHILRNGHWCNAYGLHWMQWFWWLYRCLNRVVAIEFTKRKKKAKLKLSSAGS